MKPQKPKGHKNERRLDVATIIQEFEGSEKSAAGRKGSLKVSASFEEALKKILKAKPERKKRKR